MLSPALAAFFIMAPTGGPGTLSETVHCVAGFDKLFADEVFDDYPERVTANSPPPVAPIVKRGQARLYRTVLREGAKLGPNFAGHYTIVQIGCGAATVCPAIVDARSGEVFFPPELKSAGALLIDTGGADIETLNYRRDSRLLVVAGTPNENLKDEGLSYYVWRSNKLTRFRFMPASKLCKLG